MCAGNDNKTEGNFQQLLRISPSRSGMNIVGHALISCSSDQFPQRDGITELSNSDVSTINLC